jgi:hypothetical protein
MGIGGQLKAARDGPLQERQIATFRQCFDDIRRPRAPRLVQPGQRGHVGAPRCHAKDIGLPRGALVAQPLQNRYAWRCHDGVLDNLPCTA